MNYLDDWLICNDNAYNAKVLSHLENPGLTLNREKSCLFRCNGWNI